MEFIRTCEKEHAVSKQMVYAILVPAIMIGSIGWGKYLGKEIEKMSQGSGYLRTEPVSRYQR